MARARYWDADAFLGWLSEEKEKLPSLSPVVHEAEAGKLAIVTSALTIAEVLWVRGKVKIPASDADKVEAFFAHQFIAIRELDRTISESARRLVWDQGIKPKDAVHVATALDAHGQDGIEQFDTFDGDLIKKSGKVGGDPPLVIGQPNLPETLF